MKDLVDLIGPEVHLRVADLSVVWVNAQRTYNPSRAQEMADNFDPYAVGQLVVARPNGEGVYHVIDGQHRHGAVRIWGGEEQRVPCRVVEAATLAEAAELWLKYQTRKAASAIDEFKIAVAAGRQPETQVDGLIRGHGYVIDKAGGEGTLRAVRACVRIHKRFGVLALKGAFEAIQACWQMHADSTNGAIVGGFGQLFGIHKSGVDQARLAEKVCKRYTPGSLLGSARSRRDFDRGSLADNVARLLRDAYNSGLQKRHCLKDPA